MKKLNLIYIVGRGHSGSTLMDLVLGAHPKIESVGEIIDFKKYFGTNRECTCGKPFKECDYWNNVLVDYEDAISNLSVKLHNPYELRLGSSKRKLKALITNLDTYFSEKELDDYALKNYYLFESILKNTGKEYILDSSKTPFMLLLSQSNLFNIKVIFLYRDLRAGVESARRRLKGTPREDEKYRGVVLTALNYVFRECTIRKILRHCSKNDSIFGITYYEFAKKPEVETHKICDFIGVNYSDDIFNVSKTNHNIGGNRLRFSKIENIKPIQKWKTNLNQFEKTIIQLLGGYFLNKKFKKYRFSNKVY